MDNLEALRILMDPKMDHKSVIFVEAGFTIRKLIEKDKSNQKKSTNNQSKESLVSIKEVIRKQYNGEMDWQEEE